MKTRGIVSILVIFVMGGVGAHAELKAGAARESIVPPFPTFMGGFGDRLEHFQGVHDEVYVRALALDDGETQLVVIGSDLMALDEKLTEQTRARIEEATGIPGDHILVSCSHNHSAPSYYQFEDPADQERARAFFVERFSAAAIAAHEGRVPAVIGYGNGELKNATRNRQQDNEVVLDTQVGVLRVEEQEGRRVIAILFNFTGHPVILGSRNLELSGEFPGAASRTVESVLGGVALFTQGACGDITVHRSGDPFLEIERLGRALAGEVIKTAEMIRPSGEARLAAGVMEMALAPKALPAVPEARERLEAEEAALKEAEESGADRAVARLHQRRIDLLRALLRQAEGVASGSLERPEYYPGSAQVMQIGELVLVGIPGELFVEYALEMRQRVAQTTGKSLCLVGYANGYVGYIVTPRAMETGGYEASVARVDVGSGRQLTEAAMGLVNRLVR